jgi:hypothetical protein
MTYVNSLAGGYFCVVSTWSLLTHATKALGKLSTSKGQRLESGTVLVELLLEQLKVICECNFIFLTTVSILYLSDGRIYT